MRIEFDFAGPDPARSTPWMQTSTLADGWSTTGWIIGPGLLLVAPSSNQLAFSANAGSELSTLADAITSAGYLAVAISNTNMAGHRVTFSIRRESWHAPLQFAVRSSVDGFAENLFTSALLNNSTDSETFTFLLPATGWTHLAQPVEFRIYPYAARYSGHPCALTAFRIETAGPVRTVSVASGPGGAAVLSPARNLFEEGETAWAQASPAEGYKFTGWSGSIAGRGNPRAFTVTNDMSVVAVFDRKASPRMELGSNLDSVTDYTSAWVFKNVFQMARPWLTREVNTYTWESHQSPPLDENGWPTHVPFLAPDATWHYVHTLAPLYTSGVYLVRFSGSGMVRLRPPGASSIDLTSTGGVFQTSVHLNPQPDSRILLLEIHQSSSNDPVRNIAIIAPGEDPDIDAQPFHSAFMASLAPYRLLRFMDWLRTNGSTVEHWSNRTTAASYTQARSEGVAHEYIIKLCNLTGKDAWICIPHAADDHYVRETARLYRDNLNSNLVLYVEYSNETWNYMPAFTQTQYVQQQAALRGMTPHAFVALRSAEIFGIFEDEFGAANRHRLVNVLASQAAFFSGVTVPRVNAFNDPAINPNGHYPDVLAIAPYFGQNYSPSDAPYPSADEMVTSISSQSIAENLQFVLQHKALADSNGMRVVAYEGGQHFTAIFGAENDTNLIARIHAANRDPRMEARYEEYLNGLQAAGMDLFVHFAHISEWSKWGAWGALEYQGQDPAYAPKWRALTNWSGQLGPGEPVIRAAGSSSQMTLEWDLRPDRFYTWSRSVDLQTWEDIELLSNLRGDDVTRTVALPPGTVPVEFWRVRAHR